jgi:hypothetical protein
MCSSHRPTPGEEARSRGWPSTRSFVIAGIAVTCSAGMMLPTRVPAQSAPASSTTPAPIGAAPVTPVASTTTPATSEPAATPPASATPAPQGAVPVGAPSKKAEHPRCKAHQPMAGRRRQTGSVKTQRLYSGCIYVVAKGDSLSSIATRILGPKAGKDIITKKVADLWKVNADSVGTGDPDVLPLRTRLRLP